MLSFRSLWVRARRHAVLAASATTITVLVACGASDDESSAGAAGAAGGPGGAAGSSGSGGTETAGSAGSSGTAGSGGAGGEAAASGSGGSGGSGGYGGSGGTAVDGGPQDAQPDAPPDAIADGPADVDADPGAWNPDCDRLASLDVELSAATSDAERVMLIEQSLLEIEKSGGFPVRCAPDATFFFRLPNGWGTPHVAGDFNGWDPTAAPMQLVAEDLYRVTLPVDTGPHRYLYKITDGVEWVADPTARRFGFDAYGEYSLVQGGEQKGHLERHFGIAGNGLTSRPLTVYLPPGYETSGQDYPVLYAHDGQNLFNPNAMHGGWHVDDAVEALLSQGEIQPLIVVGIHNTAARIDEYTHEQDSISGQVVGGMAEAYYGLVRTRVMPLMEDHYRTKSGPENTWTMGSSLGGLISLYFGLEHGDVFGRVAGLSSTLGWGSIEAENPTLMDLMPTFGAPPVVFYLDSGGDDGGGCVDSDGDGVLDDNPAAGDNYCETVQMRDALEAAGYSYNVDLFHWHEPGAEHNEAAWAARVDLPLKVLAAP